MNIIIFLNKCWMVFDKEKSSLEIMNSVSAKLIVLFDVC